MLFFFGRGWGGPPGTKLRAVSFQHADQNVFSPQIFSWKGGLKPQAATGFQTMESPYFLENHFL